MAKYAGKNRVDLIESNEYGYCSLIKATKQVLDKLDLENRTATKITSKERHDTRLWNAIAIREAVINAIVHNDYSKEVPPKFEIFSDRLEITSAGGLPEGLHKDEFFEGYSIPRNKEIMRIYKDLEMVEYLGSGIPHILTAYSKDSFLFTDNFLRMVFPSVETVLSEDDPTGGQMGGQIDDSTGDSTGGATGGAIGGAIKLTPRQKEILNIIRKNTKISYRTIAENLKINESAVLKHLNNLKEKGVLKRIEGTRGYWEVYDD